MEHLSILIETTVSQPVELVWKLLTLPEHVKEWNSASDDWYTPSAESNLTAGGEFHYQMSARDGSFSFDFGGTYEEIIPNKKLSYVLGDGRKVCMELAEEENGVRIREVFDAEETNPPEMQKDGWQSILDHFKRYAEAYQEKEGEQ